MLRPSSHCVWWTHIGKCFHSQISLFPCCILFLGITTPFLWPRSALVCAGGNCVAQERVCSCLLAPTVTRQCSSNWLSTGPVFCVPPTSYCMTLPAEHLGSHKKNCL